MAERLTLKPKLSKEEQKELRAKAEKKYDSKKALTRYVEQLIKKDLNQ